MILFPERGKQCSVLSSKRKKQNGYTDRYKTHPKQVATDFSSLLIFSLLSFSLTNLLKNVFINLLNVQRYPVLLVLLLYFILLFSRVKVILQYFFYFYKTCQCTRGIKKWMRCGVHKVKSFSNKKRSEAGRTHGGNSFIYL